MGEVTRVLITGATGFLGRATVAAARRSGWQVMALSRSGTQLGTIGPGVTGLALDLSEESAIAPLTEALSGCDLVIHLAASMSQDRALQNKDTLNATRNLLAAMAAAGVGRLVLASSIAVYDHATLPIGGTLTEDCPLVEPEGRTGVYGRAKRKQEDIARQAGLSQLAILRPGILYDPRNLWNAHLGILRGNVLLRIGGSGELPMCHVDRCAEALVAAGATERSMTLNVYDAMRPSRDQLIHLWQKQGGARRVTPALWPVFWLAANLLGRVSPQPPGVLDPGELKRRMLPLRYDDSRLRKLLPGLSDHAPDWSAAT